MERARWTDDRLDEKMDRIDRTFELIRQEMGALRTELRGDIGDLRTELRGEIGELRTDLRGDIGELRTDLRGDIGGLRAQFTDFQSRMVTIGFALVGVLSTSMVALIIAVAA
jgi:hypothetical protein